MCTLQEWYLIYCRHFVSTVQLAISAVIRDNQPSLARMEHTAYLAATQSVRFARLATPASLQTPSLSPVHLVATLPWAPVSVCSVQQDHHVYRMTVFHRPALLGSSVGKEV